MCVQSACKHQLPTLTTLHTGRPGYSTEGAGLSCGHLPDDNSCAYLLFQHDSAPLCILGHIMLQRQLLHQLLDLLICNLQLLPLHTQLQLQLLHHTVLTAGQGCCLAAVRLFWLLAARGWDRQCELDVTCLVLLLLRWLL